MTFKRLLAMAMLLWFAQGQAATVSLSPGSVSAVAGSQFTVDVVVDGLASGQLVGGFDLDLVFDASVLGASSILFGSALGLDGVDQFTSAVFSPGRIDFAAVSLLAGSDLAPLQIGPFSIAKLVFDALAPGTSTLAFDLVTAPGVLFSDEFGSPLTVDAGPAGDVRVTAGGGGTALPEPGSLALAVLALAALAVRQRSGKQR